MSGHHESMAKATAALMDMISRGQAIQAAVIRDAARQEVETLRADAHSVLDAYLDHTEAAAMAVRAIRTP